MRGRKERYREIRTMALMYARKRQWASSAEWWIVRALIPDSWFTKSGPGTTHEARLVWNKFTTEQKAVAVECGFFPEGGPRG